MSFDIRARHEFVSQCISLPQVIFPIVIGYMGNEVVGKRFLKLHDGYVAGVHNHEIFYVCNNAVYTNETKLPVDARDIHSIDKWTKGRYLICKAGEWIVCEENVGYVIPDAIRAVLCYDRVYYEDSVRNLYEHHSQWETHLIARRVFEWGCNTQRLYYLTNNQWIHSPDQNPLPITPDTHCAKC